jgi:hypothetical protein
VTQLDGPLSDQTLDRLRISASMAMAMPEMAVEVRVGETICLEVRRTPGPEVSHRVLPPCAFHRAVAHALAMRRSGERIAMRGVPAGIDPTIDWGVAPGARLLSGGIMRVEDDAVWLHAVPVLGDEHHIADAIASVPELDVRRDGTLGVAVVSGRSLRGDKAASRTMADALLDVVARAGVADLEQRLCGRLPTTPEQRAWR